MGPVGTSMMSERSWAISSEDEFTSVRNPLLHPYSNSLVVIASGHLPWIEAVADRLNQLSSLLANWDSYGSEPMKRGTVEKGLRLLLEAMPDNAPAPQTVPTSDGGLQFEWNRDDLDLEVEINEEGIVSYLITDGDQETEDEGEFFAIVPEIRSLLKKFQPS